MIRMLLGVTTAAALASISHAGADKELAKLQGRWSVVSAEVSGLKMPKEKTDEVTLIVAGNKLTFKGPERDEEMTFKIDPSKKPKQIDITHTDKNAGVVDGIYSLEGDNLKLCYGKKEKDRPPAFATKEGDRRVLFVLKRQK